MSEEMKDLVEDQESQESSTPESSTQEEVIQEETVQDVDSSESSTPESSTQKTAVKEEDSESVINYRKLREKYRRDKQEKEALAARLREIEAAQAKKASDTDFDDDEFDPHAKEIKILKKQQQELATHNSRMRLNVDYPDFTKVVTAESIENLEILHPDIFATLNQGKDTYSTGVATYNIIKKFGLHNNEENASNKEKVASNLNKPRPVTTLKSSSPLANARDYSDLKDKQVRDEIIRIATERAGG